MNTEKPTPPAVVLSTALLNPLPCPFCGHVGLDFREGTTFRWLLAECGGCGATCGETRIQTLGEGTRDEWMQQAQQDAIEVWNMRFNARATAQSGANVAVERDVMQGATTEKTND